MLGEPRLNVCILDADISPRLRERLQAQVQTAIRSLPRWPFALLTGRMSELGVAGLPLIVEPVNSVDAAHPLGLGDIEGRPAARLRPRVSAETIEWGQDPRYLVAKAIAFMAAPPPADPFWLRWADAIRSDSLREKASDSSAGWKAETDVGLLLEMFAAFALRDGHQRWSELQAVHAFLREWRGQVA
jgi:hypothetical protein